MVSCTNFSSEFYKYTIIIVERTDNQCILCAVALSHCRLARFSRNSLPLRRVEGLRSLMTVGQRRRAAASAPAECNHRIVRNYTLKTITFKLLILQSVAPFCNSVRVYMQPFNRQCYFDKYAWTSETGCAGNIKRHRENLISFPGGVHNESYPS